MAKTFFISTPIYYPSGKPHIGHAYSTILADVLAKYKRLLNYEVFFVTGTDEHGKKIADKAKELNLTPQVYVDQMVQVFIDLWKELKINYSIFLRTTSAEHTSVVQRVFSEFLKQDLIYLDEWNSWYCITCEENITNSDLIKKGDVCFCKHGHKLIKTQEESYFFKMSRFQHWIKNFIVDHPDFIFPHARSNELLNNFLNDKLMDLSISRTSFAWGIPIRENPKHVIYVWMDALFSYLSCLGFLTEEDNNYKKFWNHKDAEIVHLLSKEITRFHCIYWPIFLSVLNLKLPSKIISHGWILSNGEKMSKSLNNVIDPYKLLNQYGSDTIRYYLIKEMSLSNDNIFSEEALIAIYNGDLANNFGNLISRSIGMVTKYTNNIVPKLTTKLSIGANSVIDKIKETNCLCKKYIDELNPAKVLDEIQNLINASNQFIENTKPWNLFKNNELNDLENMLHILFKVIEVSIFWLEPVINEGVKKAKDYTNINPLLNDLDNLDSVDDIEVNENHTPIYLRIQTKNFIA